MTTQRDIANKLQLSRSLVAGILNDTAGVRASDEVRQRVLRTAAELRYRPHAAARALRSGRPQAVAFHFTEPLPWERAHVSSMIETLSEYLGGRAYHLIVNYGSGTEDAVASLHALLMGSACEIFILHGREDRVETQAQLLEAHGLPFITPGDFITTHPDWSQVDFDQEQMMATAVAHLTKHGHRRIAYLGHDNDLSYARRLRHGFRAAVAAHGLTARKDCQARVGAPRTVYEQMRHWLGLPSPQQPTAVVFGGGDEEGWHEMELALAEAGRTLGAMPPDFAAVGVRYTAAPLLFGEAHGYLLTDYTYLTRMMCERLLAPLLDGGAVAEPVLRVMPPLQPFASRHLWEVSSQGRAGIASGS